MGWRDWINRGRQKIDDLRRGLIETPKENIRRIITHPKTTEPPTHVVIKDVKKPKGYESVKYPSGNQRTFRVHGGGGRRSSGGSRGKKSVSIEEISKPKTTKLTPFLEKKSGGIRNEARRIKPREQSSLITPETTKRISNNIGGGLLYLKEEEAEKYTGRMPVWKIESKTIPETFMESQYSSMVRPSSDTTYNLFGISTGQYEYNLAQVKALKEQYKYEKNFIMDVRSSIRDFKKEPSKFVGAKGIKKIKTKKGFNYILTEDYFKNLQSYKSLKEYRKKKYNEKGELKKEEWNRLIREARKDYSKLPKSEKFKGAISEIGISSSKVINPIGRFMAESPLYFMKNIYDVEDRKRGIFPEREIEKRMKVIPTSQATYSLFKHPVMWGKETLSYRPYPIIQGAVTLPIISSSAKESIKNIEKYGKQLGIKETFSSFSPIQIQRTFTPRITGRVYGFMEETKTGDLIKQRFVGTTKEGNVFLRASQQIKSKGGESIGAGKVKITSEELKYIGGEIFKGGQTSQVKTISFGERLGKGYKEGELKRFVIGDGYKSEVFSQPEFKVSYYPELKNNVVIEGFAPSKKFLKTKGAGTRKELGKDMFMFKGGKRKAVYGLESWEVGGDYLTKFFKYSPKGYKFKTEVEGIGLRKITEPEGEGVVNIISKPTETKINRIKQKTKARQIEKFYHPEATTQVKAGIEQFNIPKTIETSRLVVLPSLRKEKGLSKSSSKTYISQPVISKARSKTFSVQKPIVKLKRALNKKQLGKYTQERMQKFNQIPLVIPITHQKYIPSFKYGIKPYLPATSTSITIPTYPIYPSPIVPVITTPPLFTLNSARGGKSIAGKKSRKEYPSFSAIYFRIFGKKAKPKFKRKFFTGFELRPISKEYKFIVPSSLVH